MKTTRDAIQLILLVMTAISPTPAYDIAEEGKRVILQSDIETVLIHTKIGNVDEMLNHLLQEAGSIRTLALKDHVSNMLGKGRGRQNKLISASIISLIKQITIVKSDYDQFFKDNAEKGDSKSKRAIEILGSFLSTMTGVPSARDHRKVLEQIRLLKLDSDEIRSLMMRQNVANGDILKTFHYQQNELHNLTQRIGALTVQTQESSDYIEKMMVMLSITTKVNTALESARIAIAHMKSIMAADKHSHLSKFVITNSQLSAIIDKIYLKRKQDIPIFAGVECHNYFSQPLAHSWVNNVSRTITTLLQIPIAPMHQISEIAVLNEANTLHADLPFAIVTKETNTYRFLSMSDFAKCLNADNAIICQKRNIRIYPKLGCNLKRKNCERWAENTVHDLSNSQILINLKQEAKAVISCDGEKSQPISLPMKAVLTLNIHCELESEYFFVGKLSYRQLREIDYENAMSEVNFSVEHAALAEERTDSLLAHHKIKETRIDISKMIEGNEKLQLDMIAQANISDSRWRKAQKGGHSWDQILVWSLLTLIAIIVSVIAVWVIKLQIAMWKAKKGEECRFNAERERIMMSELSSQMKDMMTDNRINLIASQNPGDTNEYEEILQTYNQIIDNIQHSSTPN